jgi:endogenous inhibitor of DNA gyrase (YacG/DUF329 family)
MINSSKLIIITSEQEFESANNRRMIDVQCPKCLKQFRRNKGTLLRNKTSFCSIKCKPPCHQKYQQIEIKCDICNKMFTTSSKRITTAKPIICSRDCVNVWLTKRKNPEYRGHTEKYNIDSVYENISSISTITKFEFLDLRMKDKIEIRCRRCNTQFLRSKGSIFKSASNGYKFGFCSRNCSNKSKGPETERIQVNCRECDKQLIVPIGRKNISTNVFCSQSCNAKYRNKNGDFGCVRSLLEEFLEKN